MVLASAYSPLREKEVVSNDVWEEEEILLCFTYEGYEGKTGNITKQSYREN